MKKRWLSLCLCLILSLGLCAAPASAKITNGLVYYSTDFASTETWNETVRPLTGLTMFERTETVPVEGFGSQTVTYYGLTDSAGNVVLPADYTNLGYLAEDRIVARKVRFEAGGWSTLYSTGVITTSGQILYPFTDNIWDVVRTDATVPADQWTNTVIVETLDGNPGSGGALGSEQQGLFDFDMNTLLPIAYSHIEYLRDGYYLLRNSSQEQGATYGIYRYGHGIVIPVEYKEVNYLGDDLFSVKNGDLFCGVMDGSGNTVLPFVYAAVTGQQDGCFTVALFRDKISYLLASLNGYLFSSVDDRWSRYGYDQSNTPSYAVYGVINSQQNILTPFTYENAYMDNNGNAVLKTWTGNHTTAMPLGSSFPGVQITVKEYCTETAALKDLKPTGETVYTRLSCQ